MSSQTTVPFVDLSIQWEQIRHNVMPEIERLFDASAFCLGPWVDEFEKAIASYLEVDHAIAVSSGSAALHLAVIAAGIGPRDKVLVPAHSFIGTLWGVIYQGAVPVFCDVERATGTIDFADAERRLDGDVKAVIPVHLYGQPANMKAALEFSERHGLTMIEDVAQAIGARYNGRPLGSMGSMGCFSFYPGKNLGAAGEGGLVVTQDADLAQRLRALRNHGQTQRYLHEQIGYNYRMDGLQALVLNSKLRHLDDWTDQRKRAAERYREGLKGTPLTLPDVVHGDHVYHLYVVRTDRRDDLRSHLDSRSIQTGLHYPIPLHRQPCLAQVESAQSEFLATEEFAGQGLSLPMFAGITAAQQQQVVDAICSFFEKGER
ncbi:DegT/DnrJ/EryC1/StrS family aminotransferase [Rhizobium sp. 57MFTsu3.2]|uniref:DegT/DnrJ/EryC1/StrS family aminotransferase n=1 Tax=Rhizobium sp. 57MFTsu3.2 TaxID=1048681 RepID=UPI00146F405B|nr:DegT/DnrJ/EryC1/StrS family aminotransferase [Rhizobium sp. 57MFTsu3.2]NMN68712.1 dTDP-4-amino-4,6-dideoxygalactose transaminase [Rhizobium sp. 57MFTsu3.2]